MARKLPGLTRALGPSPLASVAYGEIGSSLYFALGIVTLFALGFTPWVLLIAGAVFLIVALSYAEGTAAIPETGGAAMLVRRAFNDPLGFMTGWALFLDYLIVIALAALFVPHYLGAALGWDAIGDSPWDVVAGAGVIAAVAAVRMIKRPQLYRATILLAVVALVAQFLIIVFGFVYLVSSDAFGKGVDLGAAPTWSAIGFAIPVAMLAYTGLETVANLAAETREPGRNLPRGLFGGIGAVVIVSFAMGVVAISAFPAHPDPRGPGGFASDLGTTWLREPLYAIANTFHAAGLPAGVADGVRVFVGISGALVLVMAVTTSISGAGRLAYSLGQRDMLPHVFGRLNRRTLIAPVSILSAAAIAVALLVGAVLIGKPVRSLAGLYSFGVLITFTAAQIAVVKLRFSEPGLKRPFRVPLNLRIRGAAVPVAALVGAPLTFAVWIIALVTHSGVRIAGPIWLAAGAVVFVLVRRSRGETVMEKVEAPTADFVIPYEEGAYRHILVPMKLGPIGEEVLATAIKLAEEQGAALTALHVIKVPLDQPLEAELTDEEERAAASLAEAKLLAEEHGVEVEGKVVRARALGSAIVEEAREHGVDLILMGSAPRWRRQSRFFSPTVDYVLRRAPCEVMVVAYPQGVLEEDEAEVVS
ncbi:MAG TPA: universal stress protein [Gaiellaceae bacterium]